MQCAAERGNSFNAGNSSYRIIPALKCVIKLVTTYDIKHIMLV